MEEGDCQETSVTKRLNEDLNGLKRDSAEGPSEPDEPLNDSKRLNGNTDTVLTPEGTYEPRQLVKPKKSCSTWVIITLLATGVLISVIIIAILYWYFTQEKVEIDKYTGLRSIPEGDICFNSSDPSSYEKYISAFEEFLKPYKEIKLGGRVIHCDKKERKEDEICFIDETWIYPCGNTGWGFDNGKPCVILYFSDNSTFEPIPYETLEDLPSNAPRELRVFLEDEVEEHGHIDPRVVSLYCTHSDPYDTYPKGFYNFFFPISKAQSSLPPIASVQIDFQRWDDDDNMFLFEGEYEVECSLWSKKPDVREVKKLSFKIKHGNC